MDDERLPQLAPGSEEAIRYYQDLVARELPCIPPDQRDPKSRYEFIPESEITVSRDEEIARRNCHLPTQHIPQPSMESTMPTIEQAIETLTDENAVAEIDRQIAELETRLTRLRTLRKAIAPRPPKSTKPTEGLDQGSDLEASLIKAVTRVPRTPASLAEALGVSYQAIGRCVAGSTRLTKAGQHVTLVDAE